MAEGFDVEVDGPDGYSKVVRYVEKGPKLMFNVTCNGHTVKASYDHLFETNEGWVLTKDLDENKHRILCDDNQFHEFKLEYLSVVEDVVDIEVANEKHRYYTDGLSSHNTNIGKTLIMCSLATNFILNGYNVLYVTFEDSENKIGQRISQNLFDVTQADLKAMSAEEYVKCFQKTLGKIKNNRLIIKEYPEGSTNALMIETLLKELSEKKNFKPDILIVDYIGCMIPNGRPNPNLNSNTMLLTVAAQIRAIGMKNGIPVISASQTNRGGYGVSEINLSDAADSFGQNMKADAVFGVTQSEEFKEQGMYSVKLLKTRYGNRRGDITSIGVDIEKQRIFDITNFTGNQTVNIFETQTNTTYIEKSYNHEEVSIDDINYSDFT